MFDISIDEAKAKAWVSEVNAELDAVEGVLKQVNSVLTTAAGSDDSIMQGIYTVGTAMENAWNRMGKAFKSVREIIQQVISNTVSSVQSVVEDTNTLKSKF